MIGARKKSKKQTLLKVPVDNSRHTHRDGGGGKEGRVGEDEEGRGEGWQVEELGRVGVGGGGVWGWVGGLYRQM